jgi:lipoprotein-releasing system permease protein
MNITLKIASRLSLSRKGHGKSPALKVAIAAVALSAAVMTASICIVTGFKQEITQRVTGFNAHLSIMKYTSEADEENLVNRTPTLANILDNADYITSWGLEISIPAVLKTSNDFKGIYLKSNDNPNFLRLISESIIAGKMPDFTQQSSANEIVISQLMADKLHLSPGDDINTYFISSDVKARKLKVAAIYNTHFENYDDVFAYTNLALIQQLSDIPASKGTIVRIQTDDFNNLALNKAELQTSLNKAYMNGEIYTPLIVDDAQTQGAGYFAWLSLLDTNVAVILLLMTLVACITLISGMLIIIMDKVRLIGILRALGMKSSKIRIIFIWLAMRIAAIGLLWGSGISLILLYIQQKFHLLPLDAESYYMDYVPVNIDIPTVIILNIAILAVVFLTLLIPSHFAASISPAEAMHYDD